VTDKQKTQQLWFLGGVLVHWIDKLTEKQKLNIFGSLGGTQSLSPTKLGTQ